MKKNNYTKVSLINNSDQDSKHWRTKYGKKISSKFQRVNLLTWGLPVENFTKAQLLFTQWYSNINNKIEWMKKFWKKCTPTETA